MAAVISVEKLSKTMSTKGYWEHGLRLVALLVGFIGFTGSTSFGVSGLTAPNAVPEAGRLEGVIWPGPAIISIRPSGCLLTVCPEPLNPKTLNLVSSSWLG